MSPLAVLAVGYSLATTAPEPTAQGAALAQSCLGCHAGEAALPGRNADALFEQLRAWREGDDPAALMTRIARGYTTGELRAIAGYLAAQ